MASRPSTILIAATFTSEPVEGSLRYWMDELGIDGEVGFAPYDQVFQQLLDEGSAFHSSDPGLNVVLVRLDDWTNGVDAHLPKTVAEFIDAAELASQKTSRPLLVIVCPSSPATREIHAQTLKDTERRLRDAFTDQAHIHLVTSDRLLRLYPVRDYYDAAAAELGDVPYTPEFFACLGTMIARVFDALRRPPRKVVVVDCDMTLWDGVCGEDGPLGVRFDEPRIDLQHFLVDRCTEGMLLCLCSKNEESDVWAVFDQRPEMPLTREHVVASRISWRPKPESLQSLARELGLALDAFIFVDDNPVECAAVRAACPEVLTVRLPRDANFITPLLRHVWGFDRPLTTSEDRRRASMYRAEARRTRARASTPSLADFLDGLELDVRFAEASPEELPRAAQLTYRTNQMNLTTVRRSEAEIRTVCRDEGRECHVVHLTDRFGDYGTVGVMIGGARGKALDVETFLLSCRALGRGVEHRMVAWLGERALNAGLGEVALRYRESQRNGVALAFLRSIGATPEVTDAAEIRFILPAAAAARLEYRPDESTGMAPAEAAGSDAIDTAETHGRPRRSSAFWMDIARRSLRPSSILEAVAEHGRKRRPASSGSWVEPRTATEREIAAIWQRVLEVDRVGIDDNFFALGGDSLALTRISARIADALGARVPIEIFFDSPTVAQLAAHVDCVKEIPTARDPIAATAARAPSRARAGSNAATEDATPGITVIGVVTCAREQMLLRSLSSYVANVQRHGRSCRYVVVDDSESAELRDRCRATLGELARETGAEIAYAGAEEKHRFAQALTAEGLDPTAVEFALFGTDGLHPTPGGNRNALALDTLGEQLLSVDDDTICSIGDVPEAADGVDFAWGQDPAEFWFFADRQTALDATPVVDADVIGLHESLLGRRAADLVNGSCDRSMLDADLASRLDNGRVAVTSTGLLGDCGLGAPFGYWIGPMGPFLLEGRSHHRFAGSEEAYRMASSSREIRRAVRRACISDHSFSMSTFLGLDHRELVPPVMPVQRGADLVFGATLWKCAPDTLFGHIPRTLLHSPEGRRPFWPGEMMRTAAGIDTARLLLVCVDSVDLSHVGSARAERLRALGEHLEELGSMPLADFLEFAHAEIGASSDRFSELLEETLERRDDSPSYWAKDLRGYLERLRRARREPDYVVPLDLRIERSREEARALAQKLVGSFGHLLQCWPDICSVARELAQDRRRLSAPVR